MKLLLTTLNSKFVHSNLAIRYLKGYAKDKIETELREYTINQSIDYIVAEIYKINPDIVGFSTYIWNLSEILEICETLKMIRPDIKIFLGGPEVSFDGVDFMEENKFIDWIIYGEGEETFSELIDTIIDEKYDYENILGLIYRDGDRVIENLPRPLIQDLNTIPSPYDKDVDTKLKNKIIYYESSRGCPFNCKFCLSSTIKGVRYFDIERVKEELGLLIDAEVRQVKFVDRTFNANKEYAMEIMNFIMEKDPKDINFHFEVTAHLLDREMLDFLSQVKEGLFQFEVGVQSTNPKTIEAVGRTTDFEKLTEVTKEIKTFEKIHQHLDLIAGLPYEDYSSFRKSFNHVYAIRPEKIQLGFLKLLKGSQLRIEEEKYGFKYIDKPPYEVLETNYIDYNGIRKLKSVEEMVDTYYNGEIFKNSIEYIIKNNYGTAFDFYENLAEYWEDKEYHKVSHGRRKLYDILSEFYKMKDFPDKEVFNEVLKLDFIENNKGLRIPGRIKEYKNQMRRSQIHDLLKHEDLLKGKLSDYREVPTRDLLKDIHIERFTADVLNIIESGYEVKEEDKNKDRYLLTLYKDGVINRARTIEVTDIVNELLKQLEK